MSFQHFSLDENKKKFPQFELMALLVLIIFLYIGGFYLVPKGIDGVERAMMKAHERYLFQVTQWYISFEGVSFEEGEEKQFTIKLLEKTGYLQLNREDNQRFFERFSADSYVKVYKKEGTLYYEVILKEKKEP